MSHSPLLLFHIFSGTLGVLSGFFAIFLRKGSRRHALAGDVFVLSMLGLSSSGMILATLKSQPGNILGGAITFYLVITSWMTARRGNVIGKTGSVDWIALLGVCTIAAFELTFGVQAVLSPTGMSHDYPPGPYFMFGSVALIAIVGDIRMLIRGGIVGPQRIARHLWRMCFAFFVAAASVFLARAQLFPKLMQKTGTLYLLTLLPLLLMAFWLVRVLRTKQNAGAKIHKWNVPATTPAVRA